MGSGTSTAVTALIRQTDGNQQNGHNGLSKHIITAKPLGTYIYTRLRSFTIKKEAIIRKK
jgi:hypothetical protein